MRMVHGEIQEPLALREKLAQLAQPDPKAPWVPRGTLARKAYRGCGVPPVLRGQPAPREMQGIQGLPEYRAQPAQPGCRDPLAPWVRLARPNHIPMTYLPHSLILQPTSSMRR